MREEGYYWVKYGGLWIVAQWQLSNRLWWVCGYEYSVSETDFEEIDEKRLTHDSN